MPKDQTEPLFQKQTQFLPSQKHDSYICWQRETHLCEQLGMVLFVRADGSKVPCTCKCHGR